MGHEVVPFARKFDSPNLTLFSKTVYQKCNYIFAFDELVYEDLLRRGVKQCYHMPLAVDAELFVKAVESNFAAEHKVSFVGSLYTNQFNYFDRITDWEEDVQRACLEVIEARKLCYTEDKIRYYLEREEERQAIALAD